MIRIKNSTRNRAVSKNQSPLRMNHISLSVSNSPDRLSECSVLSAPPSICTMKLCPSFPFLTDSATPEKRRNLQYCTPKKRGVLKTRSSKIKDQKTHTESPNIYTAECMLSDKNSEKSPSSGNILSTSSSLHSSPFSKRTTPTRHGMFQPPTPEHPHPMAGYSKLLYCGDQEVFMAKQKVLLTQSQNVSTPDKTKKVETARESEWAVDQNQKTLVDSEDVREFLNEILEKIVDENIEENELKVDGNEPKQENIAQINQFEATVTEKLFKIFVVKDEESLKNEEISEQITVTSDTEIRILDNCSSLKISPAKDSELAEAHRKMMDFLATQQGQELSEQLKFGMKFKNEQSGMGKSWTIEETNRKWLASKTPKNLGKVQRLGRNLAKKSVTFLTPDAEEKTWSFSRSPDLDQSDSEVSEASEEAEDVKPSSVVYEDISLTTEDKANCPIIQESHDIWNDEIQNPPESPFLENSDFYDPDEVDVSLSLKFEATPPNHQLLSFKKLDIAQLPTMETPPGKVSTPASPGITEIGEWTPDRRITDTSSETELTHLVLTSPDTPSIPRPISTPTRFLRTHFFDTPVSPPIPVADVIIEHVQVVEPPVLAAPGDPKWLQQQMSQLFCQASTPQVKTVTVETTIALSLPVSNELLADALGKMEVKEEQPVSSEPVSTEPSIESPVRNRKSCLAKPDMLDKVPDYFAHALTPCSTPLNLQFDKTARPPIPKFSRKTLLRQPPINLPFPKRVKKCVRFPEDAEISTKVWTYDEVVNAGGSAFRIISIVDHNTNTIRFPKYVPPVEFSCV
ncbi:hypothetical protein L5515_010108 [Caenorhabditis briggsae]|uniref:Uncharacterized protein n=2 Tax=Caenorhabditis briggsae TaxID=6238 RepID=A0AAE9JFF8_CAEBR|nr:hypothetical protein L5515_010108 [Caenorhabditis briggsae]